VELKVDYEEERTVERTVKILDLRRRKGRIIEVVAMTDSNEFIASIDTDWRTLLSKRFDELVIFSKHVENFQAYRYGDLYVFRAVEIPFRERVSVELTPSNESFTLKGAMVYYEEERIKR